MDMLRFITAGSVDDGKSTLIGRLLYDAGAIFEDQLAAMRRSSRQNGIDDTPDLAILTDGLRAEREQGITIDVAHKYFATDKRKFIIADAPGHVQYTRNMVTGASNCDLAIILVDARHGIVEQTKRHTFITHLLGIKHIVLAINKMDLVDYSEETFYRIAAAYKQFIGNLHFASVHYLPISALQGENIVQGTLNMPWYEGSSLLHYLETIPLDRVSSTADGRMPVQWVIRPQSEDLHDYRGFAGQVVSGTFRKGDRVQVLPSGITTTLTRIETYDGDWEEVHAPLSVILHLADDIDVSRGSVIASAENSPHTSKQFEADICWMDDEKNLAPGGKYLLQHHSRQVRCIVQKIDYKVDIHSLDHVESNILQLNDIAGVVIKTAQPISFDLYVENKANGAFILIDEATHNTVAAGMVKAIANYE